MDTLEATALLPSGSIIRGTFHQTHCEICESRQEDDVSVKPPPTRQAVDTYLQFHRNNGFAANTINLYMSLLKRFAETFEILPTTPEPIEEFLSHFS